MRKYLGMFFLIFLGIQISGKAQTDTNEAAITIRELHRHLQFLASDSLRGRYPGTTYDKLSAKYIKDQFERYGLRLLCSNGFQFFSYKRYNPDWEQKSTLLINGQPVDHSLGISHQVMLLSKKGPFCGKFTLLGYQSEKDSLTRRVKLSKRWALIIMTQSDSFRQPVQFAEKHGAIGALIVSDKEIPHIDTSPEFPVIVVKNAVCEQLLGSSKRLAKIKRKIEKGRVPYYKPFSNTICSRITSKYSIVNSQNIVAMLPADSASEEYIVVGAHYDHLGMGGFFSGSRKPDTVAVHNGADDNASGVSALLELARLLTTKQSELKRNILFIAFGAEEAGLIGSQKFISKPVVAPHKIKAMVNLDMIGRLRNNTLEISGMKSSLEADSLVNRLTRDTLLLRLKLSPSGFGPSDHASFYTRKIPVFFITTGIHKDYHTPFDDIEKINFEGMKRITDYTARLVYRLATMPKALTYSNNGKKIRTTTAKSKLKVKLGIMPDINGSNGKGLTVLAVTKDKPADKAGIKDGDIITALGKKTVTDIFSYMKALKLCSPGTSVPVTVLRNGKKHTFTVNL